ncbi:MAG: gamma-glutamyltransferase, partial [Kofleriaceae bacterium]
PPPPPATGSAEISVIQTPPLDGGAGSATPDDGGVQPVYRDLTKPLELDDAVLGTGKTFMVVTESAQASQVGKDILASGGNAVDAAIATAFALAVVHPTAGNLGGGGFAVVRVAPGKAVALDFREVAPAAATETMFLDEQGKPTLDSLVGHRAAGVPGAVAGMWELHRKLGKKPWKELVEPSIALARGFEVDAYLAAALARPRSAATLKRSPASAAIWYPGDKPLEAGAKIAIPELAATLERIAARGRDGFYKGETAAAIVAEMKAGRGIITAKDLASYKAVWREPLRFPYRGHTVVSMPLPSSGGIVLGMTAGMLRQQDLKSMPWHGAAHIHWLAEVWKRAFSGRNELLGDPAFVKNMPVEQLLSQDYLDRLAATIDPNKASPSADVPPLLEGDHTTNLCVVDGSGMAVAMTTTLNTSFGNGVTVTGAGFLLNNEMDDFSVKPGSPNVFGLVQGKANRIEPGKRMLSSMSPSIVEDASGKVVMLAGAGGGPRIITAVWQTISNVIDFGQRASLAVANPRVHHQHLPDLLRLEPGSIDRETEKKLREMGHALDWASSRREFGAVTAIVRTAVGWEGSSDPRGGGGAMGD